MSYGTLDGAKTLIAIDARIRSIEKLESLASGRMSGSRAPVETRMRAEFVPKEKADLEAKQGANASQSMAMNDTAAARIAMRLGRALAEGGQQEADASVEARAATNPSEAQGAADSGEARIQADHRLFLAMHRALFAGTAPAALACQLRSSDDQLGGDRFHKVDTPYHTPAANMIVPLLDDAAAFCIQDSLPALAQAALAHTQIMLINPFERGNGKIASAVIQLVLSRRGVTSNAPAPISLGLMMHPHDYQDAVAKAIEGVAEGDPRKTLTWIELFARSCLKAASTVKEFDRQVDALEHAWFEKVAPRSNSVTYLLLLALRGMPVFDIATIGEYTHRSLQRVSTAVDELVKADIVTQITKGKRNRVFEVPEVIAAYGNVKGIE